jgi:hypothetical protein
MTEDGLLRCARNDEGATPKNKGEPKARRFVETFSPALGARAE